MRKGGQHSAYNKGYINIVLIAIHEIGHNLGLRHSNENGQEYGDDIGYMGNGGSFTNNDAAAKCFNAAKSFDLEWYSSAPARVAESFNPMLGNFNGKLVGVADYGDSSDDHTVVLEIKNPDSSIRSLYLAYNRAKGINKDTTEAPDQMTLIEAATEETSSLIAKINPGSVYTINNYHGGRPLSFIFGAAQTDDSVDYVPVTVDLQGLSCVDDNDCIDLSNQCSIGRCIIGECSYEFSPLCCGNGVCDTSDGGCGTCTSDCTFPTHCNEIADRPQILYYNSGSYGFAFDVTIDQEVFFYELDVLLSSFVASGVNTKVYTRTGSHSAPDSNDLNNWDLVFDKMSPPRNLLYESSLKFDTRMYSEGGSTRAFYVSFDSAAAYYFEASGSSNIITITRKLQQTGDTMPGNYQTRGFSGSIKYDYVIPTPPDKKNPGAGGGKYR